MKKIVGFLIILSAFLPNYSFAQEKINNFVTEIKVNKDSSINVTEEITYTFEGNKHGIFRDIIYKYQNKYGNFNFVIRDIKVSDYSFVVTKEGKYTRIKIGDSNVFVSGTKTYKINYTVDRAIGYFNDFDEIYWNATGNEWKVPILKSSARILLPQGVKEKDIRSTCYQGIIDSKESCGIFYEREQSGDVIGVKFTPVRSFGPMEGLTVALGFSKSMVDPSSVISEIIYFLTDNFPLLLPVIVFFVMFYLWYTKGRDLKGKGVIIPQYDVPEELAPMEVAAIVRDDVKNKDISAEIINLAIKGYLRIEKKEKTGFWGFDDYIFTRSEKNEENLKKHEETLLRSLFKHGSSHNQIKLSHLNEKFYLDAKLVIGEVSSGVVKNGYYDESPATTRGKYMGNAIIFLVIAALISDQIGGQAPTASVVSFFIILAFSFIMSRKSRKGVEVYEHILGLKEYLQIAEKDRINFHNAPEKKPEVFEKFLPYAMVFGVEKAWAKEFEGIYTVPPNWYQDPGGISSFNAIAFTNNLNNFRSYAKTTLTSSPSSSGGGGGGSSGGGSSGGGGGGGGGGSW